MILITDIKFMEVNGNIAEIEEDLDKALYEHGRDQSKFQENMELKREIVQGRLFVKPNGEQIIIGMSAKNKDLIGFHWHVYEKIEEENQDLRNKFEHSLNNCRSLERRIDVIKNLGFWRRLLHAFFGFEKYI